MFQTERSTRGRTYSDEEDSEEEDYEEAPALCASKDGKKETNVAEKTSFFGGLKKVQCNLPKTATQKRPKNGFQDQLSLNAGQRYCRMLQGEHSVIL